MPRSNRPRDRRRRGAEREEPDELDLSRVLTGFRRTEFKRDGVWTMQPIPASNATKTYVCPGCGNEIEPGVAHVVAWRADGIMGDEHDLAARRHWHTHCWRIKG